MGDILNGILQFVYIPFGMIFKLLYLLVQNYGVAIILFALLSKIALLPLNVKNEKSRRLMQKLQPQLKEIQKKYNNDTANPKYNEEVQDLYAKNGTSMTGGCGWQFIQLPIIWAIWNAIRNPITYIWNVATSSPTVNAIATRLFNAGVDLGITVNEGQTVSAAITSYCATHQITLASAIPANADLVRDLLPASYSPINLTFCGLDLGALPTWTSWTVIVPILSALTSFAVGFVSQKVMAEKNAALEGPTKSSVNTLLYIMPIISLIIGFTFNIAIGLYWILSNVFSIVQTVGVFRYVNAQEAKNAPVKKPKEKKLNYNQIAKMEREKKNSENEG